MKKLITPVHNKPLELLEEEHDRGGQIDRLSWSMVLPQLMFVMYVVFSPLPIFDLVRIQNFELAKF